MKLYFLYAFSHDQRGRQNHQRARRRASTRLTVEPLEHRTVPAFLDPLTITGNYSGGLLAADFDNDNIPDLAATDSGMWTVRLGNGDGTFGVPLVAAPGGGPEPGDFNRDGNLDVVLTADGQLVVLLGTGNGTFQSPNSFSLPQVKLPNGTMASPEASAKAVGDLNNDGKLDLVVAGTAFSPSNRSWGGGTFYVYLHEFAGDGSGGFRFVNRTLYGSGQIVLVPNIKVADFNRDGMAEIFTSPLPLVVADFDGDGVADRASIHPLNNDVRLSLSTGIQSGPYLLSSRPSNVAAGDVNGDGAVDVVTRHKDGVSVLLNYGNGIFQEPQFFPLAGNPLGLEVSDLDGDGFADIALFNGAIGPSNSRSQLAVLLNDGDWGNPPPPQPSLTISDATVTEGHVGPVTASSTVTLSAASTETITVAYATGNGTAIAGSDYQAVSGTLTFAPGQTTRTITVPVIGDTNVEPNETFFVNLTGASGAIIDGYGQGVGTITNDDYALPQISISDVTKAEGKKGKTTLFTFTVTLSAAYDEPVTMSFRTVNGTAKTSNNDYIAKTGTLTFAPGETTKMITIKVKGDSKREANETFYLDLFGNSSNALFTKNRGLGTILNDD